MIEKFIDNPNTIKRWRRFRANRAAFISAGILGSILFLSITAEFWANSRPLYLKFHDKSYFPVAFSYHPTEFGQEDVMVTNYRTLQLGAEDSIIWPIITWDPFESNNSVSEFPSPPTRINLLGTDESGRDVFSRILYGFRYSIIFALLVWFVSYSIGIALGGSMGFFGGRYDMFGQRVVEVLSTVPQFFLLIIMVSIFMPTMTLLVILTSIFGWIPISYYVRGEFLKNRKLDYVDAARALGGGNRRIIFRHILPNSMGPVITLSPFFIATEIVALASLDYLGFGLPPPTPSWGELLNQARQHFNTAWWLAVYPSLALFLTLVALSLVGDGIKDALDPRRSR